MTEHQVQALEAALADAGGGPVTLPVEWVSWLLAELAEGREAMRVLADYRARVDVYEASFWGREAQS